MIINFVNFKYQKLNIILALNLSESGKVFFALIKFAFAFSTFNRTSSSFDVSLSFSMLALNSTNSLAAGGRLSWNKVAKSI